MKKIVLIFILFFLFGANISDAAIPRLINYQGRVTDTQGTPLTGSYSVTFRIYDAASSGNLLWEETHAGLVLDKGMFSVLLGSVTVLNIPFDKSYFLEIKVGNEVMSPRQQIASSAYAMRAENADKAKDSETIMGTSFNATPAAGKICPLDNNSKFPQTVIPNILGAWETKTNNTVYQAATDGFVVVTLTLAGGNTSQSYSIGYTDGANPPATIRGQTTVNWRSNEGPDTQNFYQSFCMPVKKGNYWKVVNNAYQCTPTQAIYWIAIGN